MSGTPIARTSLPFPLVARGKVRDVYEVGADRLLIVATDRISAFDVVLPQPIPFKGQVLTQVTAWWLSRMADLSPHHLIALEPEEIVSAVPRLDEHRAEWEGRAMLVRRTRPFPVECVVRGYLSGSAWKEYRQAATLAGEPMPAGLVESARLEAPIFSPATKAESGHDQNITFGDVSARLGAEIAEELRRRSLALYARGRDIAEEAGVIIADTKFEFGQLPDGRILLIDEVLTPDSSRFWPRESYSPGRGQPSLDKQPVRDFLEGLVREGRWNREPPAPDLPGAVVQATTARYLTLYRRLTGRELPGAPAAAAVPGGP